MEKKIVPTPISFLGNKRKTIVAVLLLGSFLLSGTMPLFAAGKKEEKSTGKKMLIVEGRGWTNLATFPGEFGRAYQTEKKDHPKAWGITYLPRVYANSLTRIGSGLNDILVGPWYVLATKDTTPLTRRLDLPDYVWNKE